MNKRGKGMVGERESDNVLPATPHAVIPIASLGVIHPQPLLRPPSVPVSLTDVNQRVIPSRDIRGEIGEIYGRRPFGLSHAMPRGQVHQRG